MKRFMLLLISLSAFSYINAQETYNSTGRSGNAKYRDNSRVKGFDVNKIILGGGLNLGFGGSYNTYGETSNFFRFGLSPIAGYKFNNFLAAGISLGYQYLSISDYYRLVNPDATYTYKPARQSVLRGGVWGRVMPINNIFAHAEFEYNIITTSGYQNGPNGNHPKIKETTNVPCLLLGAGYRMPVTDRVSIVYMVLYDVLQNTPGNTYTDPGTGRKFSNSPYAGTLDYRIGINIGY